MIKLYNFDELKPEEILNRDIRAEKNVEDVVDGIIADVRARGDDALKDYALKFDGAKIDALQVTQEEIDEAFAGMDPYFLETLREAAANIESFHRQQVHKNFVVNDKPGIVLGQKYTPIEKAGVYVPGGTAAYPSTVLMDVIPAKARLHWSVMRSFCSVCTAAAAPLWEAAPEPAGAAGAAAPPQPVSNSAAARTTAAKHLCFMAVSFHLQSPGHVVRLPCPGQTGGLLYLMDCCFGTQQRSCRSHS